MQFLGKMQIFIFLFILFFINFINAEKLPSYLSKIHELREAINRRTTTAPNSLNDNESVEKEGKKKPKKYKCILVDVNDDDDYLPTTTTVKWITNPSFAAEIQSNNEQSNNEQTFNPTNNNENQHVIFF